MTEKLKERDSPAEVSRAETRPGDGPAETSRRADSRPAEGSPAGDSPADTTPTDTTPAESTPAESTPAESTPPEPVVVQMPVDVRSVGLTVLVALAGILMLQYAASVFIPVVIGVLISYVLAPAVGWLEEHRVPRAIGASLTIFLLCGSIGVGVYALADEAMQIIDDIPVAAQRVAERMQQRVAEPEGRGTFEKVQEAARQIEEVADQAAEPSAPRRGVQRVEVVQPTVAVRDYLWAGGRGIVTLLGQFTMVMFLVFFLLLTGDLFKRKLVSIAGPTLTKKKVSVQIVDEINRQITNFLRVQVLTNALVAVGTGIALWAFGVENYILWGILSGIFNSIPYLGPLLVTGGLGVVTFMQFDEVLTTVYVCSVALAITSLEGWLLRPALIGRAAQMNPVAIFVGLLFWTWVWGVWGTVLAVPMMTTLKAICDRVEGLQPIGELLGE
jgi:predicted PurR-regulated permease PerM